MSDSVPDPEDAHGDDLDSDLTTDDLGSLSVEDDPDGTVDPADLAGTALGSDAGVGYEPAFSEADEDVDGPE